MAGFGNGGGEIFHSNERRPSYVETGYNFIRTVRELKEKLDKKGELGNNLKVLKARDDTEKGDLYALKSQIRANRIDIKKLQRDKKNIWKELKIEVKYDVEKNHKYRFFDAPPGAKKVVKALGLADLVLAGTVAAMTYFGEQVNRVVGFPTSSEAYSGVILGFALNTIAYTAIKINDIVSDAAYGSVKRKVDAILDQYKSS